MLVSIITVVLNARLTIEDTIASVLGQTYKNIEYIVIDGRSTDGTLDIVNKYRNRISKVISESDKGIYDAMNKGIKLASGEIIGILNSDDFYVNDFVIEMVVKAISEKRADACYGDLVYVDSRDTDKIIRYWESCTYKRNLFRKGWHPPHSTFFVKKWVYEKYGGFDLNYPVASDYEILYRFMEKYKISSCYIPQVLVKMRLGGFSNKNVFNIIRQNIAIIKILKKYKIRISPFFFCSKIMDKLRQFRSPFKDRPIWKKERQ